MTRWSNEVEKAGRKVNRCLRSPVQRSWRSSLPTSSLLPSGGSFNCVRLLPSFLCWRRWECLWVVMLAARSVWWWPRLSAPAGCGRCERNVRFLFGLQVTAVWCSTRNLTNRQCLLFTAYQPSSCSRQDACCDLISKIRVDETWADS